MTSRAGFLITCCFANPRISHSRCAKFSSLRRHPSCAALRAIVAAPHEACRSSRCYIIAFFHRRICLYIRRCRALAHPHVWVTMTRRAGLCAGRQHHRRESRLGLRRHVLRLRHARVGEQGEGQFTREELAPLAKVNVESLEGIRLLHLCHRRRQEGAVDAIRCPDYWLDYDRHRSSRCTSRCRSRRR